MQLEHSAEFNQPISYVVFDGESIPIDEVRVIDIEEDFFGRDVVTFEYAGTTQQSFVIIK